MTKQVSSLSALTKEQFDRALPKKARVKLTHPMVNEINTMMQDPQLRENFRDNLLSYTGVMNDGKYKIESYVNAVRYVSHKLLGSSNIEAYCKTFPGRFQRLVNEGATDKVISSYSTAFNKTALVNKIMEQTLVPTHILNADLFQKALNKQAALMNTAHSEKVQCDAANSLLTHLKQPEESKIKLDVNVRQDKSIDELNNTILALAKKQKDMIESGLVPVKQVAHSKLLIEGEVEDV